MSDEMKHLSQEQIVLHYYGDAEGEEGVRRHLRECPACRKEFEQVQELLSQIEPVEVPEPSSVFEEKTREEKTWEEKTWLNLRDRLPVKHGGFRRWFIAPRRPTTPTTPKTGARWGAPPKWAMAGAMALLLVAAFVAGRYWPRQGGQPRDQAKGNPQRVVLVAVGGHLERSQMLLVEIMNADDTAPLDLSAEQQQARDLLDDNHLYRLTTQRSGDPQVAHLLDDLGRVLAEIANGPSDLSPGDLQQIQRRIQSENLLFKVRVVASEVNSKVRRQDQSPAATVTQRL